MITITVTDKTPRDKLLLVSEFLASLAGKNDIPKMYAINEDAELPSPFTPAEIKESENEFNPNNAGAFGHALTLAATPYGSENPSEVFGSVQTTGVCVPAPQMPINDLDSEGMPYDERIHASSRAKIANGTWKKKRGIKEQHKHDIETEVKNAMNIPAPAEPNIPAPSDKPKISVESIMGRIAMELTNGRLKRADIPDLLRAIDPALVNMGVLMQRRDLAPQVDAALTKWLEATNV